MNTRLITILNPNDRQTRVKLSGDLLSFEAMKMRQWHDYIIQKANGEVEMDLEEVGQLDLAGVNAIISLMTTLKRAGKNLKTSGLQALTRHHVARQTKVISVIQNLAN